MRSDSIACIAVLTALVTTAGCAHGRIVSAADAGRALSVQLSRVDPEVAVRVRELHQAAVQERDRRSLPTAEDAHPDLERSLSLLAKTPTPSSHLLAATEYLRLGIADHAFDQLTACLKRDPEKAACHDLRARILRDSGFPQLALADAYRAVFFAPASPEAHNTLGTVLHRLGHRRAARLEYETALRAEPEAPYALNNLCALALEQGESVDAFDTCLRAVTAAPQLEAARRNFARALSAYPCRLD